MSFKRIVEISEKVGLLRSFIFPRTNAKQFQPGPIGTYLQEILKNEWIYSTVINKDLTVFLSGNDVTETFQFARKTCMEILPFGIAEIITFERDFVEGYTDLLQKENDERVGNFERYFAVDNGTMLKCTALVSSKDSMQFFHQWQKQRRMWWRKFSPAPGRYYLTDIKSDTDLHTVDIIAKYPWGSQVLENLYLCQPGNKFTPNQFKEGRKTIEAHAVISKIDLSVMFLNALCDAYTKIAHQDERRELFKFHRKLAPYKLSFAIAGSNQTMQTELLELTTYLCRKFRNRNITSLLLPSSTRHTLEAQYTYYDELGIPYTILINESTLRDGICRMRSRDTTLKEQVHVTDLEDYIEKLFKNY